MLQYLPQYGNIGTSAGSEHVRSSKDATANMFQDIKCFENIKDVEYQQSVSRYPICRINLDHSYCVCLYLYLRDITYQSQKNEKSEEIR